MNNNIVNVNLLDRNSLLYEIEKDSLLLIDDIHLFLKLLPNKWKEYKNHIHAILLYNPKDIEYYCHLDFKEKYILYSPVSNQITLESCIQYATIDGIICKGDSKGKRICDYDWIYSLFQQCKQRSISFNFISTGNLFRKDGKVYFIPNDKQKEQATKAKLNYEIKDWYSIDIFARLSKSKFRNQFHLKDKDFEYIDKQGIETIEKHGREFIQSRLSPEHIENDGKQTPMRGHPIFIAQHATACCCRGCLKKWHNIEQGKSLSKKEEDYILSVLMKWISKEIG